MLRVLIYTPYICFVLHSIYSLHPFPLYLFPSFVPQSMRPFVHPQSPPEALALLSLLADMAPREWPPPLPLQGPLPTATPPPQPPRLPHRPRASHGAHGPRVDQGVDHGVDL